LRRALPRLRTGVDAAEPELVWGAEGAERVRRGVGGVEELQEFSLELNKVTRELFCSFTIKAGGETTTLVEVL
jgi:hypothetical protein